MWCIVCVRGTRQRPDRFLPAPRACILLSQRSWRLFSAYAVGVCVCYCSTYYKAVRELWAFIAEFGVVSYVFWLHLIERFYHCCG